MKKNIEKIKDYIAEKEDPTLTISPIPRSNLWLIGQKPKHQWKIYVCNPLQTKMYLISKSASEEEYHQIWNMLVQLHLPSNLKKTVKVAKKQIQHFKLNKNNQQNI